MRTCLAPPALFLFTVLASGASAFAALDSIPPDIQVADTTDLPGRMTDSAMHVADTVVQGVVEVMPDSSVAPSWNGSPAAANRKVVVRGRRTPGSSGQRRTVLEGDALLDRRGGNLAETLEDLPGMGSLGTGTVSKPVLNGLHSQRLPVLVDGIRLEGQSWGGEHAPEVDPFAADRLVVVRGGAGVRYGAGALGGAIVAEPAPLPVVPGFSGEALATASSNGPVLGTAAKATGASAYVPGVAWRLQGSWRKGGDQSAPDVVLPNTALEEHGVSGALGWKHRGWGGELSHSRYGLHQGLLSSAHIGNLSDLRYALERGSPPDTSSWSFDPRRPDQLVDHDLTKLRFHAPLPADWRLEATLSRQGDRRREWDAHRPIDAGLAAKDAPQLDYELRSDAGEVVAERTSGGWRTQLGGALDRQENEYAGRAFVPNFRSVGAGAWGSVERMGETYGADLGVRWETRSLDMWRRQSGEIVHESNSWDGLSTGAGVSVRPGGGWVVRGHAATAWRPPSAVELRADGLHHGTASIERGDTTLGAERSWTGQLALERRGSIWNGDASLWATRIDDYIGLYPDGVPVLTVRGAFPSFRYKATDALLWGADATSTIRFLPSWEASLRGDLLFTRDGAGKPLPFAPVHKVVAGIDARRDVLWILRDAKAGPRLEWLAEADALDGDYAPPPPSVWLLGFEAGAGLGEGKKAWRFSLSGRNLTNRTWRDPTDRLRYFAPRPGAAVDARISRTW